MESEPSKNRGDLPLDSPVKFPNSFAISSEDKTTSSVQWKLIGMFLVFGLLLRFSRFLMQFPLWEDEAFLCANLISRNYFQLLEPLQYHQVSPVFFLWIQLTVVKIFGYHEFSLRMFPFLCSLASLGLYYHVAKRLLSGYALVIAIGIFTVAYPNIRYAAEAKQYSSDLLVGLIFLAIILEWWRSASFHDSIHSQHSNRWLWGLLVFTPFGLGLSYPAVFAAGAASLFLGIVILRNALAQRSLFSVKSLVPWLIWNVVLVSSFLLIMSLAARGQNESELDWMGDYWKDTFPPMSTPAELPGWLLKIHAGSLLAFPVGGEHGASSLTLISLIAGAVLIWRKQKLLAVLLFSPAMLHLIAAGLERYPYGGHVKFSMHMGAMVCLVSGLGAAWIMAEVGNRLGVPRKSMALAILYLFTIGGGSLARDIAYPYKTESDMRARAFARWFWSHAEFQGEVACVENDLGVILTPDAHSELSWAAMYRVNKEIYGPSETERRDFSQVSAERPLRCVIYRVPHFAFDQIRYDEWLQEMQLKYELIDTERLEFPRFGKHESARTRDVALTIDFIDVFRFIPRSKN